VRDLRPEGQAVGKSSTDFRRRGWALAAKITAPIRPRRLRTLRRL
jgi:hypothetical protein